MDIETIKQDRQAYSQKANHIQNQISQFTAELHGVIGAYQYCDQLITKLEQEKKDGESEKGDGV